MTATNGRAAWTTILLVALLVTGCAAAATPSPTGGPGGSSGTTSGTTTGGGGNLAKVDACTLLTPTEIQGALGYAVQAGVNQDSDVVKQCEWDSADSKQSFSVGITVRTFTDKDWSTVKAFPKAEAVSGLGEEAYKNSPLTGDLSVKQDGYEIDFGIANFTTKSQADIDKASLDLMKLAVSRV